MRVLLSNVYANQRKDMSNKICITHKSPNRIFTKAQNFLKFSKVSVYSKLLLNLRAKNYS